MNRDLDFWSLENNITLKPKFNVQGSGYVSIWGNLVASGTNNILTNQILSSSASILTRGLADARYAPLGSVGGTGGASTDGNLITATNAILHGELKIGSTTLKGGNASNLVFSANSFFLKITNPGEPSLFELKNADNQQKLALWNQGSASSDGLYVEDSLFVRGNSTLGNSPSDITDIRGLLRVHPNAQGYSRITSASNTNTFTIDGNGSGFEFPPLGVNRDADIWSLDNNISIKPKFDTQGSGYLSIWGNLVTSGTNNILTNQMLISSASILTRSLGDGRYLQSTGSVTIAGIATVSSNLVVTGNATLGATTVSSNLVVNGLLVLAPQGDLLMGSFTNGPAQ